MEHLIESSIEDLFASAVRAFPNTTKRQHATQPIIIEELHWMPFRGMKTLFIKGLARNENRQYNTIVLFKNVDYGSNEVKIVGSDGLPYSFAKLSVENTDVALRCNCQDFMWRFNYYNHLDKSLYGNKRSKYENAGGPPANPSQLPGMCKHILKTIQELSKTGIFIESTLY